MLEQLDLDDATIVGFSMGGGEVARYLGTYGSDRLAKAVLASAVPPYLYKNASNPDGALDDDTIATFEEGVQTDRLAFLDEVTTNFFSVDGRLQVSEAQRLCAKELAAGASPKGTLDCIAAFGRTDFRQELVKIDVPTLVIHGDSDAVVPFEASGMRAAQAITNSSLEVIAGGPHGCNISHAALFNDRLVAFVAS